MTREPIFDKDDQFRKVQSGLLQGETILAVYDAIGVGTGFIGLTSKRVILQDNSFVGGKVAVTSVPYSKIQTVSFVSDKSMFGKFYSSSTISIQTSGKTHEVSFRGTDKAIYTHNVILWELTK